MLLFDTPPSADTGPARHGEPHYDYLCRTGRPPFLRVRELIESWVAEFPRAHRKEITVRLRSRHNHHFEAAFFELYIHALFRRLGYVVRIHPRAGSRNKRPDFLIAKGERPGLLVEALSVTEGSDASRAQESRLNAVYDALNRVHCPDYFLRLEYYGELTSPLPGERLRRELRKFLDGLDYEAVRNLAKDGSRYLPKCVFIHDSFRLELGVIPVSPQRRGHPEHRPLGVHGPGDGAWVDHHTPLKDRIGYKAHHYGQLRRPLVLAINAAGGHADSIDVMQALFGTERWIFSTDSGEPREAGFVRASDGALIGPRGPQNRNVSAILIISALLPWTVATSEPVVYHNPWARYPTTHLPESLTQIRLDGQQMVSSEGSAANELLALPKGWPHFDRL